MRFIGRIFVIFFAFLFASIAAGITIAFGLLGSEWQSLEGDPVAARGVFLIASFFGTSFAGAAAFLPLLLLAILTEAFRLRSVPILCARRRGDRANSLLRHRSRQSL